MRFGSVMAFVSLYVTVNLFIVSTPIFTNGMRNLVPQHERKESQQLVLDLARNFSSLYFQKFTQFVSNSRIVSPLSVFIPISMLAMGARRGTRRDFLKAIGLPGHKTRMAKIGYSRLLDQLAKYDIRIKTKIFIPPGVQLNDFFAALSTKVFNSEIETVNVSDGFMDSEKINEWVAAQTNDNVTTLFKPHVIGRDPIIVLVNTVYFKGIWKKPFDNSLTVPRPFHPFGRDSFDVPTMYAVGLFPYGRLDDLNLLFIELPFKSNSEDDAMSMFILLPDKMEPDGWAYNMPKLHNMNLTRLLNSTTREVELYLPKFRIETMVLLNDYFDWTFQPVKPFKRVANFSGISLSSSHSNFGESSTKIVIEIDEKGQETAESSGISYDTRENETSYRKTRSIARGVTKFVANHPFVAMIVTKGRILTDIFSIHLTGSQFKPGE